MFLFIFKIIIKLIMTSSRFDLGPTSIRLQKPWTSSFYGSKNGPSLKTLVRNCPSFESFSKKKPGCLGWGNALSLPSITTTEDMLGLSSGRCCMHKRLRWMQCNSSDIVHDSPKHSSSNSKGLPLFHSIHA